ncbi:MAG: type VII toxin-antitoxin system MntA family adenylyltransferase antitoxin [Verrucomicrobiota bacterium]
MSDIPESKSNESASLFQRLQGKFAKDRDLRVAILYGSTVSGRMCPDSDVDVAVLYDHPLTADEKIELMGRLQDRLNQPVDLVDLATANGVILQQILCNGKLLVKNDPQSYVNLLQRMIYAQEDFMPYYRRELRKRVEAFANDQ